jgi:hypothetical protein
MTRECKYECGTLLGDFDETEHKYKEAETGYLHTQERCKAAKDKAKGTPEQTEISKKNEEKIKNGKEEISVKHGTGEKILQYVDHTAKGIAQFKIFWNTNPDVLENDGNGWLRERGRTINFRGGQFQMSEEPENRTFAICLYYEEVA